MYDFGDRWNKFLTRPDLEWLSDAIFELSDTGHLQLKKNRSLWVYPDTPPLRPTRLPAVDVYFRVPVFLWMPHKMWGKTFRCPNGHIMGPNGYNKTPREVSIKYVNLRMSRCFLQMHDLLNIVYSTAQVLDTNGYYFIMTERNCCRECKVDSAAWMPSMMGQCTEAEKAHFPAVLTKK